MLDAFNGWYHIEMHSGKEYVGHIMSVPDSPVPMISVHVDQAKQPFVKLLNLQSVAEMTPITETLAKSILSSRQPKMPFQLFPGELEDDNG